MTAPEPSPTGVRAGASVEEIALHVDALTKAFGATRAVDGVTLRLRRGTVHALLGGNGSGKSTTIKLLAGVHRADSGTFEIDGRRHDASSFTPAQARDAGLRFVHQGDSTFPELTIAENLAIGHGFETAFGSRVRWREQLARAREVLQRFEIDADPRGTLAQCGVATQMMIAIARALQDVGQGEAGERRRAGVLVLDEPTAALPPGEVDLLLDALRRFAAQGQTILYVTHRLDEVVQLADEATVLRDGRVAGALGADAIEHDALVGMIVGRAVRAVASQRPRRERGTVRLSLANVAGGAARDATLEVCGGEIVALAGLLGSGRSSLLRTIVGDVAREAGTMLVDGEPARFRGPRQAGRAGLAYAPEDRRASAAFLDLSVRENMGVVSIGQYLRAGRLRHGAEMRDARRLIGDYHVKAASSEMPLATLSGGNQQKALLVRWLRMRPRILLLDEPTQGVDVGARAEIWQLVRDAVDQGAAALTVLSDYEELVSVCDRAIVLSKGRTVTEMDCEGLGESALEHMVLSSEG